MACQDKCKSLCVNTRDLHIFLLFVIHKSTQISYFESERIICRHSHRHIEKNTRPPNPRIAPQITPLDPRALKIHISDANTTVSTLHHRVRILQHVWDRDQVDSLILTTCLAYRRITDARLALAASDGAAVKLSANDTRDPIRIG